MSSLFIDYRHSQTPINEEGFIKQKEWDDDLRVNDIVVGGVEEEEENRS